MNSLGRFPISSQWGHIASEIARARRRKKLGDTASLQKSLERTLLLLDQLIENHLETSRSVKEICRLREFIAGIYLSQKETLLPLVDMEKYCIQFLKLARVPS